MGESQRGYAPSELKLAPSQFNENVQNFDSFVPVLIIFSFFFLWQKIFLPPPHNRLCKVRVWEIEVTVILLRKWLFSRYNMISTLNDRILPNNCFSNGNLLMKWSGIVHTEILSFSIFNFWESSPHRARRFLFSFACFGLHLHSNNVTQTSMRMR